MEHPRGQWPKVKAPKVDTLVVAGFLPSNGYWYWTCHPYGWLMDRSDPVIVVPIWEVDLPLCQMDQPFPILAQIHLYNSSHSSRQEMFKWNSLLTTRVAIWRPTWVSHFSLPLSSNGQTKACQQSIDGAWWGYHFPFMGTYDRHTFYSIPKLNFAFRTHSELWQPKNMFQDCWLDPHLFRHRFWRPGSDELQEIRCPSRLFGFRCAKVLAALLTQAPFHHNTEDTLI